MGALQRARRVGNGETRSVSALAGLALLACWCVLAYLPVTPGNEVFWRETGRTLTVGFFLLAVVLYAGRWQTRVHVIDTCVGAMILSAGGLTLLARLIATTMPPSADGRAAAFASEFAIAVVWAGIALVPYHRLIGRLSLWARAALLAMAACQALRAGADAGQGSVLLLAVGFQLLCSVIVVGSANAPDRSGEAATRSLSETLDELARLRQLQRERLHDARSALTGVVGATSLLLDGKASVDSTRLQALLVAEVERLQCMLDTEHVEPTKTFDLASCLEPVVLASRAGGARIGLNLRPATVVGQPRSTATVVDNLLRNARIHAPGARVWVRIAVDAGRAAVIVEDDGPGIPAEERSLVVLPGVRGSAACAPGSGLGLHIAATSMRAQSGSLAVTARPGGGTRVVCTLPLAGAASANPPTTQMLAS